MSPKRRAFTLVEMMIVAAIIMVLVVLLYPNVIRSRIVANDTNAKANLKNISSALENYMSNYSSYPADTDTLLAGTPPYINTDFFTGSHGGFSFAATLTSSTYSITATPTGPVNGSGSMTMSTGGVLVENF